MKKCCGSNSFCLLLNSLVVSVHKAVACRLEKAVLDTIAQEPPEGKTPDLKGTGTTRSFTDAVIRRVKA